MIKVSPAAVANVGGVGDGASTAPTSFRVRFHAGSQASRSRGKMMAQGQMSNGGTVFVRDQPVHGENRKRETVPVGEIVSCGNDTRKGLSYLRGWQP